MTATPSRGSATWITGSIYIACFYVMSFGPACRLVKRDVLPERATATVYAPMILLAFEGPPSVRNSLVWYARVADGEQALWNMRYQ
jgi:hypothetical protein